ncbi:MAG: TolB family protein [Planctomycetota bacterium]
MFTNENVTIRGYVQLISKTLAALLIFAAVSLLAGSANAQFLETVRQPLNVQGESPNGHASETAVSADGQFIAFVSAASDLVENDTNNVADVFWYDRSENEIRRISVASDETEGNAVSMSPSISADGRYVVFVSYASNLVANDTNSVADIFVYDSLTGNIGRASLHTDGSEANDHSVSCVISGDGNFVIFKSLASNLVDGDTNAVADLFSYSIVDETTVLVSLTSEGFQANGVSSFASVSDDGRYVAFASDANNFVANDDNNASDVFVRDMLLGTTIHISKSTAGQHGNGASTEPRMDGNGLFVVFRSSATNFDLLDVNGIDDIYFRHLGMETTTRVSVSTKGIAANANCRIPSISLDGRYISFVSTSSTLAPFDTNFVSDLFLYDRDLETTQRINLSSLHAQADAGVSNYSMSSDASAFVFISTAADLAPEDNGGFADVFVTTRMVDEDSDYFWSIDMRKFRGVIVDSMTEAEEADRFHASGSFEFNAYTPDAKFNPFIDDVTIQFGDESGPNEYIISANDPNWKVLRNQRFSWRSSPGETPACTIMLDMKRKKFIVKMSKFDFDSEAVNPIRFNLGLGLDWMGFSATWNEDITDNRTMLQFKQNFE